MEAPSGATEQRGNTVEHSHAALYYHIIFRTNSRVPLITVDIKTRLCDY